MAITKVSRGLLSTGISDSSDATAITIDSSEKVGIGETSPLGTLHVKTADSGASADSGADELVLENSGDAGITILSGTSNSGSIRFGDSGDNDNGIIIYNHGSSPYMRFFVDASERMRIDSSGLVGIGQTPSSSDGSMLQITGSDGIQLKRSGQTNGFVIRPNASTDGIRFTQGGTGDRMTIDSNGKTTIDPAGNFFDDSAGVLQLRASTATGGWAISARSTVTTSTGYWYIGKQSNGTNVFSLTSDSDSIDLSFLSDERIKMNITDSADVLDKVKQITVKDFDWRTELNGDTKDDTRETKKYGFIAQNFQSIGLGQYVKELMPTDENDDTLGMDYGNITPILVKAIQEQQEQIEALQSEINTLKGG
jgi:hypothetical protein